MHLENISRRMSPSLLPAIQDGAKDQCKAVLREVVHLVAPKEIAEGLVAALLLGPEPTPEEDVGGQEAGHVRTGLRGRDAEFARSGFEVRQQLVVGDLGIQEGPLKGMALLAPDLGTDKSPPQRVGIW